MPHLMLNDVLTVLLRDVPIDFRDHDHAGVERDDGATVEHGVLMLRIGADHAAEDVEPVVRLLDDNESAGVGAVGVDRGRRGYVDHHEPPVWALSAPWENTELKTMRRCVLPF